MIYKNMSEILKDGKVGDFELNHFEISEKNFVAMYRMGISPGRYIRLCHKGECVMSDTNMEKRTNSAFVCNAHEKVLIGGLGIGMIVLAIQDMECVEKITIVEKYQEVIDLVKPQLPLNEKVEVVNADVFDYVPTEKYNTIYMDIWNWINSDIYNKQMKPLISRYRKYLVPKSEDENRFIDCWCKNEAKKNIRL